MNKVALYFRLSVEEQSGREESESIISQRNYVTSFFKAQSDLKDFPYEEYIDDGFSGSNTKRPGFERMMNDVKANLVKTNYAWIQHMIHHMDPSNGKIGLVLANGSLSSTQKGEGDIRQKIIEDDLVEGIIALPSNLFYSVTIPACLWFISKNKKQKGKTVFIDARNMGEMVDRKHRDFSDEDIKKIADTFAAFQDGTLEDVKGFCAVAETAEIAKQDYILTPGRYVGIAEQEDDGEPFEEKMERLTSELSELFAKSHELENEIRERLEAIGFEI